MLRNEGDGCLSVRAQNPDRATAGARMNDPYRHGSFAYDPFPNDPFPNDPFLNDPFPSDPSWSDPCFFSPVDGYRDDVDDYLDGVHGWRDPHPK